MADRHRTAAASRDGHLALRRAERQQQLVEILVGSTGFTAAELADRLRVSIRTVERDIERLRDAGVPFTSRPGRGGGISLDAPATIATVDLDPAEIAAIISSLAIVGPNSSPSAASATVKLVAALRMGSEEAGLTTSE